MRTIYIPTKQRPDVQKTLALVRDFAEVILAVEPQEKAEYKKHGCKMLVLPEDDQGIAYVRNSVLEDGIRKKLPFFWMMDDDISSFTFMGKKASAEEVLLQAEVLFQGVPDIGQGALEYGQFSWSQKSPLKMDGYCDVAVCLFPKRIGGIRYRPHLNLKEDRDFTLQVLASGSHTARAAQCGFTAPKNGSNAGGLKPQYQISGREADAVDRMCKEWPGVLTRQVKKDGRVDCKINWKKAFGTRRI